MSETPATPRWRVLVTPRWLSWHLFAVVAIVGMIWLGDWQLRRALSGNTLSWAYTFEWPLFAIFGVVFWVKTVRDELRPVTSAHHESEIKLPTGTRPGAGNESEGAQVTGSDPDADDPELAEYNAYLARLSKEAKGHGRWHGLR